MRFVQSTQKGSDTVISIREATIEDLHLLREVGMNTYSEHFSEIWTEAGMQNFLNEDFSICELRKSIESPASHCWLIASDEENRTVGFAKVNWSKTIPISGETGAELQKIYFLKSQAGKGYGAQLLRHIEDLAQSRKAGFIWLDVLKTNANAQRFYENSGFKALGEIPFCTDKAEIGMVVMCCELTR
jgi:ribosomal protein S18 acetylase RimI-like enzyme